MQAELVSLSPELRLVRKPTGYWTPRPYGEARVQMVVAKDSCVRERCCGDALLFVKGGSSTGDDLPARRRSWP